jgi:hypothetical protein
MQLLCLKSNKVQLILHNLLVDLLGLFLLTPKPIRKLARPAYLGPFVCKLRPSGL